MLERRRPSEVAATYGVARSWVYELVARYRVEGDAALEAHSRLSAVHDLVRPPSTVELVLRLRCELTATGLDAGADTIGWHLERHHGLRVSRATIYRIEGGQ